MSDDRQFPTRPWVGVGVVVLDADRVLLVRRARPPRMGQWGLPGGAQHLGETLFEAAAREVLEETGIVVEPLQILTALDSIHSRDDGRVEYHYTLIEVLARPAASAMPEPRASDDVSDARWIALDDLADYGLWDKVIAMVTAGREHLADHIRAGRSNCY